MAHNRSQKIRYYINKRHEIIRLIENNYNDNTRFLTLTFKDDVTDYNEAYKYFKKFMLKLKYYLKKKGLSLKYIAVHEIQNKRKSKTGMMFGSMDINVMPDTSKHGSALIYYNGLNEPKPINLPLVT